MAPVKAPISWPKSSLSNTVGCRAAQLNRVKGSFFRRLRETIASEMRSDFSGLEQVAADLRRRGGPGQLALGLALGSPEFQRH